MNSQTDETSARTPLLIVGLDGVTWDVLRPLMAEGRMPHLARLVEGGGHGVLHSTVPPITPAAWTTFLTGKSPGRHGVIDFERYDPATNRLMFNSTLRLEGVQNIWQILGARGYRVGSINIPMTYPARPMNGFLISGFETPGTSSDFVYPPELRDELVARWNDPTLRTKWRRAPLGGLKLFRENVDYMSRSFHQGAAMTRWCGERFGWDVLMVVFKLTDNLQHKTWKHIDPRWREADPARRDVVKACWGEADAALGDLVAYAGERGARVMVVSDHGHGSLEGKVQVNRLLLDWGYLELRGDAAQGGTRVRHLLDRLRGRTKKFARSGDILQDLAVDFSRTRACVMHAGMAGFLYINLKGRQPCGIVEPAAYESLRDEIRERLLDPSCSATDPRTGREVRLFSAAHKPEALYGCSREAQPWMPDLMLIPHESLSVVRKIRGRSAVSWLPDARIEGTHRPTGVWAAAGAGLRAGATFDMQMADCAPTILAMAGCPIPGDLDGRVAEQLFTSPPPITYEQVGAGRDVQAPASAGEAYSERDLEAVTARLSDLGYLE